MNAKFEQSNWLFLEKAKHQNAKTSEETLDAICKIGIPTLCLYGLVPNLMKILSKRYVKASHVF